jgi:hypothetical protein
MTFYHVIRQQGGAPELFSADSTETIRQRLESPEWPPSRYKIFAPRPEGAPPWIMDGCWGYAVKDASGKVVLEE